MNFRHKPRLALNAPFSSDFSRQNYPTFSDLKARLWEAFGARPFKPCQLPEHFKDEELVRVNNLLAGEMWKRGEVVEVRLEGIAVIRSVGEEKRLKEEENRIYEERLRTCYVCGGPLGKKSFIDTVIWGRAHTRKLRGESWSYEGEDEIFPLLDDLFKKVVKKLKDNAHIYVFTSWKKWHKLYPIAEKYFNVDNCLVWNKQVGALCEHEGYNYVPFYDLILFAEKGRRRLNYETRPGNILNFTRIQNYRHHPYEKPVDLLKALISYSTVEGETVFDPFAGSGSTLVAAEELGRNWIGIEINPRWYEVAKASILELKGGKVNEA